MTGTRVPGHRLETVSVRGGILAECSCGEPYRRPGSHTGVWMTWDRPKIRAAHQAHLADIRTNPTQGE